MCHPSGPRPARTDLRPRKVTINFPGHFCVYSDLEASLEAGTLAATSSSAAATSSTAATSGSTTIGNDATRATAYRAT